MEPPCMVAGYKCDSYHGRAYTGPVPVDGHALVGSLAHDVRSGAPDAWSEWGETGWTLLIQNKGTISRGFHWKIPQQSEIRWREGRRNR